MMELTDPAAILMRGVVLAAGALIWVLVLVRIVGLRSFSKMTAFDFVATVAIGSLLANAAAATGWSGLAQSLIAIAALLAVQAGLAAWRKASPAAREVMGNTPALLMRDGEFIEENLRRTRVARQDVLSKLRMANVHDLRDVRAVVLENTGDISVMHGGEIDPALLADLDTGVAEPG
ncbi:YetF domain-containing protein [Porphyrobacter sp. YT40]|uniref:DUF421 domain-containing protein n=1 Tax=Porphyrobacter sp. YT40 TaxID=2547601 RepID=UPI001142049E|nr:YetF domain-containing protein [Porphyrobacter sp. YT40]QDH34502.1 DUF421 domain-containing protein [Porphyrobacter sp. YT40]